MSGVTNRFGIKAKYWEQILKLLSVYSEITDVLLFGSRAKGTYKPGSDIDLCLKGSGIDEQQLLKLRTALDDLNLPWQIDLIHYEAISNEALIEHINRVGISLL